MLGVPPPCDGWLLGVPPPCDGFWWLGVIELLDDVFDHFCLFFERLLVVCTSRCTNMIQVFVDQWDCLVRDFLEWNDEFGIAVEGDQVDPRVNRLMLNCFSVAFGMYDFHELFDCIDCMLEFVSLH